MTKRTKTPPKQPKKPRAPRSKTGSKAQPKTRGRGRAATPRVKATLTRSQAYRLLRSLGVSFANDTALAVDIPDFVFVRAQRLNFLDRALDNDTQTLASNSLFGGRYRSTWDAQDELFSTASSRNFIEGLLNGLSRSQVSNDVWQRWGRMVDLVSALRIPTRYSGFSTATEVMQHPTAAGTGFFSPLEVAGEHGSYDSQRVQYIGRAIQAAQHLDAINQLRAAMRAAIEFSLNYFTAPVTANNVKPYSTKSGVDSADESLQAQLESRERIKEIYVQLGGNLRNLPQVNDQPTAETPEQSWDRPWQQGLTITGQDPFPVAPPSPRRSRRQQDSNPVSVSVAVTVGGSNTPQVAPNLLGFPTITSVVPSIPRVQSNPISPSIPITGFTAPVIMFPVLAPPMPRLPFDQLWSANPFKQPSPLAKSSPFDQFLTTTPSFLTNSLAEDVLSGLSTAVDCMSGWLAPEAFKFPESQSPLLDGDPPISHQDLQDSLLNDLDEFLGSEGDWQSESWGGFEPMLESDLSVVSDLEPWEEGLLGQSWDPSEIYDDLSGPEEAVPMEDEAMFDGPELTADMLPAVQTDPSGLSFEDLMQMMPNVPTTVPGASDVMPLDAGNLTPGMFPTVPSEAPGALEGMGGEAAGGEAAGSEAVLALLA